jgi:hypothetical protein
VIELIGGPCDGQELSDEYCDQEFIVGRDSAGDIVVYERDSAAGECTYRWAGRVVRPGDQQVQVSV